jgi:DNA-binding beta-propeller fold protein YncE
LAEGSPDADIAPTVLKYVLEDNQLTFVGQADLAEAGDPIITDMGSHHADVHPDGVHMYVGSTEGNVYVIDMKRMEVITSFQAGIGAGHTTFVPERNIAVITNHRDTFVTIVDTGKHRNIKNITVSGESQFGEILQSHSSFVHPDMRFFYELDLEKLEVTRELDTGGTPLQGVFMCDGEGCGDLM